MPIDGINGTAPADSQLSPVAGQAAGLGGLDSEAFLKLLVAQLRYQNPMSPSDGSAMLQQTAQFTQVETLQKVSEAQQQLLSYQQTSVASNLVGRDVTVLDGDGEPMVGVVDSIQFSDDGPVLMLGGHEVPLDRVVEVRGMGTTSTESDSTDSETDSQTDSQTSA